MDEVFRLSRSGVESIGDVERLLDAILASIAAPAELSKERVELQRVFRELDGRFESRGKSVPSLLRTIDSTPLVNAAVTRLVTAMRDHAPAHEIAELNRLAASAAKAATPKPAPVLITGTVIDQLYELEHNRSSLAELERSYVHAYPPIFFVGAGMSVPSKFPTWTRFLEDAAHDVGIAARTQTDLKTGRFEEAAERLEKAIGRAAFDRRLKSTFGGEPHVSGPITMLPHLTNGPVVTTNYDRVLEKVFADAGHLLTMISGARLDAFDAATRLSKPYLLKLHGDVESLEDRVLTLSEYRYHYGASDIAKIDYHRKLPFSLRSLFSLRTAIFLGCSLQSDRTVRLMGQLVDYRLEPEPHYAICELPEGDVRARRAALTRFNIVPIFYRHGQHDDIYALLEELSRRMERGPIIDGDLARLLEEAVTLVRKPHALATKLEQRVWHLTKKGRVPLLSVRAAANIQSEIDTLTRAIGDANRALERVLEKLATEQSLNEAIERYRKAGELLLRARDSAINDRDDRARERRQSWYSEALHAADEAHRSINMLLRPPR